MDKKKLILIISIIVIALVGLVAGGILLGQKLSQQNSPEFTMNDGEYLVSHSPWHKQNEDGSLSEKLIWFFKEDGTGNITTNGGLETHEMKWLLDGSSLTIETDWLYTLTDHFSFTTDREKGSFTIVDTEENKVTTFVFSGNML